MQSLFLAMALYPEVQKKAQAEIDIVVGPHRLPDFEDRPFLPYINAIVKESMRWNLVLPLCASLLSSSSSSVPSWRIMKPFPTWLQTMMSMMVTIFRKGRSCLVMDGQYEWLMGLFMFWLSLFRSILHDPKVFNNPEEYQPERYLKDGKLNPNVMDRDSVAFGHGRRWAYFLYIYIYITEHLPTGRICPGRHLSDSSLYLIASCVLAVYNIKPPVDNQANVIELKPEFTHRLLT